jgi:hypothetical protein
MATYFTSHPDNIALKQRCWLLTLAEGHAALPLMDVTGGSYWHQHFAKPLRAAKRSHAATFRVTTAGFTTSELANILAEAGCDIATRESY